MSPCLASFKATNCSPFDGIVSKHFSLHENISNYKAIFVKDANSKMYCSTLLFAYLCFTKLCLKDNFIICDSFPASLELSETPYLANK